MPKPSIVPATDDHIAISLELVPFLYGVFDHYRRTARDIYNWPEDGVELFAIITAARKVAMRHAHDDVAPQVTEPPPTNLSGSVDMMGVSEATLALGVVEQQVRKLARTGRLEGSIKTPNGWQIPRSAVEARSRKGHDG